MRGKELNAVVIRARQRVPRSRVDLDHCSSTWLSANCVSHQIWLSAMMLILGVLLVARAYASHGVTDHPLRIKEEHRSFDIVLFAPSPRRYFEDNLVYDVYI